MAGLGIEYPPPIEDVPIFDPLLFLEADFALTTTTADARYLRFPTAQGKETMQDMDVNGLGTFFNGITLNGALGDNLTNNQNIIMNGTVGKYIQFPDGTQQTTAPTANTPSGVVAGSYTNTNLTVDIYGNLTSASNGTAGIPLTPTGVVAGNYTLTNLTVNQYGQITTASSGSAGSNVISTQLFTNNANITFPAGTQFATIMITGAGGASGGYYYNGVDTSQSGGAGGAGGCCIFDRIPMEASTSMNCVFSGGTCVLGYLPIPQTPYYNVNVPIATAYTGLAGTTATGIGGNPAGGAGGGVNINFTGFGYGLSGATGGPGQQASSSPFLTLRGVNFLTQWNQNMFLSTTVPPYNYGIGGHSRINNGETGDVAVFPAGSAVCIVISYSS